MEIVLASTPEDLARARELFQEYATWLKVDLCFQSFAQELASLPGAYAPPRGRLLLAKTGAEAAGCVALRPVADEAACEMKRLFVRPQFQRRGWGKALAQRVIAEASLIGYSRIVLDTLHKMQPAISLYKSLGFVPRTPYYETPLPHTVFMQLDL